MFVSVSAVSLWSDHAVAELLCLLSQVYYVLHVIVLVVSEARECGELVLVIVLPYVGLTVMVFQSVLLGSGQGGELTPALKQMQVK